MKSKITTSVHRHGGSCHKFQKLFCICKIIVPLLLIFVLASCHFDKNISTKAKTPDSKNSKDAVRIANDSLEYEVIIFDSGFNSWLAGRAKPRGFYSESYLENKNQMYIREWNSRVLQPERYRNLYDMTIDYDMNIHYGYEVNYLIYNYMVYFQIVNNQRLSGFVPSP